MKIQNIDFLSFQDQLTLKKKSGKPYIYDPIRKKDLVFQPEEFVRQLILQYLIQEAKYPINRIAVERGLKVHGLSKRCDILIYSQAVQPIMLIECKAPTIKLNQTVFQQIATYNISLQVPYLLVSNGADTYCAKIDFQDQDFQFLNQIPSYSDLQL